MGAQWENQDMTAQDNSNPGEPESARCQPCQVAVTRAYHDLRARGLGDRTAFFAAVRLCAIRHPERGQADCIDTVAGWLADDGERLH